jgi:hypothetical protein
VVSVVLTVVFRRIGLQEGWDETRPSDYTADPVPVPAAPAGTRIRPFRRSDDASQIPARR